MTTPLIVLLAAGLALLPLPGHGKPPTVPMPAPIAGRGYHLVKNWDFGTTVRTKAQLHAQFYTRYLYNNGTLDTLNDEWERYRDDGNHVLNGHTLGLTARLVGGLKSGGIESGMLRSRWTGEYGYFECRMKAPPGRGMWPAFWLNPQDGKWPPEIDVVEIVSNGRDTTANSFHYVHSTNPKNADVQTKLDKEGAYRGGFDDAAGFHTFAVEWTPDTVRHYVDGVLVVERRFYWTHTDGTDGGPAHVLVNLAVGGSWPGPPLTADEFPATLAVQYIRVWQKDPPAPPKTANESGQ